MGENEQGGMLRTVVVVGLVALIAVVVMMGVVGMKASMTKNTDSAVSAITKNTPQVGGRNLVLNSSGMNASDTSRPAMQSNGRGTRPYASTISYNPDSITLTYTGDGTQEWYYAIAEDWQKYSDTNIDTSKQYTISVDVKGTVPYAAFRINDTLTPLVPINSSTWTKLTYTFKFTNLIHQDADRYYIRLNAVSTPDPTLNSTFKGMCGPFTKGQTLSFKNFKLETGNTATDWTPAPED